MDYKDYIGGATKDYFWFRAKNGLIEVLLNKLGFEGKVKILNLGAGTGDDLPVINKFGNTYVIDKDRVALRFIPDELISEKILCDACNISFPDNSFDLVVAFDVLEHIDDDILAINEIHRVLKPGGFIVFTVPAFKFMFSSWDADHHHVRRYDKKTIKSRFLNFKCIEVGFWMCTLFIPLIIQRILTHRERNSKIHYMKLPESVSNIFYSLLKFENYLIKHGIRLPVGSTIYGIYKKQ